MSVTILAGHVLDRLAELPDESVQNDGRFQKGEHRSPATEFKPGTHWRPPQLFREKEWLEQEYVTNNRSAGDIAAQFGVTDAAILFWLRRHEIPRRSTSEARAAKHWGLSGSANGMYGRRGAAVPSWKGGVTPERQAFYASEEWTAASRKARERDHGICRRCDRFCQGKTHLHHMIPFAVISERANPDNLVSLCPRCHRFVHSKANVDREFIKEGGE